MTPAPRFPHLFLAALLLSPLPATAAEIEGSAYSSGFWGGAAEAGPGGELAYCHVSIGYSGGETLWMSLFPDDTMTIYLATPDANYQPGQTFTVSMLTEVGHVVTGPGSEAGDGFVAFPLTGIDDTIQYLTNGAYLRLLGIGNDQSFDIRGIGGALAHAKSCLVAHQTGAQIAEAPKKPAGVGSGIGGGKPIIQSGAAKLRPLK